MWLLGDCSELLKQVCWKAQNYSEVYNCGLKDLDIQLWFWLFFLITLLKNNESFEPRTLCFVKRDSRLLVASTLFALISTVHLKKNHRITRWANPRWICTWLSFMHLTEVHQWQSNPSRLPLVLVEAGLGGNGFLRGESEKGCSWCWGLRSKWFPLFVIEA